MVHTRPHAAACELPSQIPPTQLVDGSYSAYTRLLANCRPKSHQRSWWDSEKEDRGVVVCRSSMNNPPTALVGFRKGGRGVAVCRSSMNNPPTALVGFRKR